MLIVGISCLKILTYLLLLLSTTMRFGKANEKKQNFDGRLNTSNMIYKKILNMRTLPFEDCGSIYDIFYLSISSCNTLPCEMRRGSRVLVNVIFDDNGKNASFLKHHVIWIFNAIRTGAIITPDLCDGDHHCLSNNSDGKTYFSTVIVGKNLALIRGTMLWEAFDQSGNVVICFRVPIVITN